MSKLKAKDPKAAERTRPKIVVFGSYGVSKTWGALSFPNCYYIDTEGGAKESEYTDRLKASGGVYLGPEDGACSLTNIIEEVKALATEKHPYKTLIIDSITKPYLHEIAKEAERLEREKIKNEFSRDKKPAVGLMKRLLMWLDKLDMNVILIAHEKSKWVGGEQTGFEADIYDKTNYDLHLVLRITKQGGRRVARVEKSRKSGFPDGDTFTWTESNSVNDLCARNEFIARMGSGIMDEATQVQLATEAQVAEINKLLGTVKLKEGEFEEKLEKQGATTVEELTTQQAEGCIKWLRAKVS